jgi:predicted Fe-Mo cluster-binding NifX family protein
MRLAVPVWNGRVSPVLDVATRLMVVDVIGREATFTETHRLAGPDRAGVVAELGVDVLVCGAVSRELEERLVANGVEVIAEVRGEVHEVIRAKLDGALSQPCFMLPGCHTRRRRGGSRHPEASAAGSS